MPRSERSCQICGIRFRPSNNGGRFCSTRCYSESLRKHPPKNCKKCGVVFLPVRKEIECCSIKCSAELKQESLFHKWGGKVVEKKHIICAYCGKKKYRKDSNATNPKCCSVRCAILLRTAPPVKANCKLCGVGIVVYPGLHTHFCNKEHAQLYQFIFGFKTKPVVALNSVEFAGAMEQWKKAKGEVDEYADYKRRGEVKSVTGDCLVVSRGG